MKNFHPKTYSYVHAALLSDGELQIDGVKREGLYILDLWADQTNIYSDAIIRSGDPLIIDMPELWIPNGNYTGEEKIINVVAQPTNPTFPAGGIRLITNIGEATFF